MDKPFAFENHNSQTREFVSDATRVLLCDFAAGDLKRSLHHVDADWDEVFDAVCRNGLLGLTHRYLSNDAARDYPPRAFRQRIDETFRAGALRLALMYRNVGLVLARLTNARLNFIVVKGPALAYRVYPDPVLRPFNDVDLIARERDWENVHQCLVGMGFEPERDLPQPPPKLAPHIAPFVPYEMAYWQPALKLMVEVQYDDLLVAGLFSRDVEGFWQRAEWIAIEGTRVRTLALDDHLIYLCAHLHRHGFARLNWFSDLAFIVRDHATEIDWARLIKTAKTEQAQVPVYYSLYFLDHLLGVRCPPDGLTALEPDYLRRRLHEHFVPAQAVLSLQPMPYPHFGFYFVPLLKRVLPDFLVMGRRWEKILSLVRALCPPEPWLRHEYTLDGKTRIAKYYWRHLKKILRQYLNDIRYALCASRRHATGQS